MSEQPFGQCTICKKSVFLSSSEEWVLVEGIGPLCRAHPGVEEHAKECSKAVSEAKVEEAEKIVAPTP